MNNLDKEILQSFELRFENWKKDPIFWKQDMKDFLLQSLARQREGILGALPKDVELSQPENAVNLTYFGAWNRCLSEVRKVIENV